MLLTFEGLSATSQTSGTPPAGTVLTNQFAAQGVVFGLAGASAGVAVTDAALAASSGVNTIVGLTAAGNITLADTNDIYFSFVTGGGSAPGITDLVSFTLGDSGGDTDVFVIHAFDASGFEIATQNVSGVARFPVTIAAAGINRVRIEFLSDPFGFSLDDLGFNDTVPVAVPEPSSLFSGGLAGTCSAWPPACRRRKAKATA